MDILRKHTAQFFGTIQTIRRGGKPKCHYSTGFYTVNLTV